MQAESPRTAAIFSAFRLYIFSLFAYDVVFSSKGIVLIQK